MKKNTHVINAKTVTHGIPEFNLAEKMVKVIPVKVQSSLKEAVKAVAVSSVSEFCREAIIEKLYRMAEEELEGSG
jgi:hypothetical protein